jgi:DNA-binding MarR family transcriptional regulator
MNESAVSRLCKLDRVIKRRFDKLADSTGINGAEGRVIHFLILNQDKIIFQKDVEIEFDLRPSSASELLKRMEKKGTGRIFSVFGNEFYLYMGGVCCLADRRRKC